MGYLVLEYVALLGIVLALGALFFGASATVLAAREVARHGARIFRQLPRQASQMASRIVGSAAAFLNIRTGAGHEA